MKNKKLMFSEARFVFNGEKFPAKSSAKPSAKPSVETPAQKVERLRQEKETAKKLSAMKLSVVELSLVSGKIDLGGKVFEVPFEKIDSKSIPVKLSAEVLSVLNLKSNAVFLSHVQDMLKIYKIEVKLEEIKAIVATVYAETLLRKAKGSSGIYSNIPKYAKAMKMKDTGVTAKISSDASGKIKVKFTSKDPDFFKKYWKWETENGSKSKAKNKPREVISKPELDRFAKSPLGKIFKFLKGGKDGKENWLQLMQKGEAPLALFIAGLFGYKIGAEAYGGVVDLLPAKYKNKLDDLQKRADGSRLSARAYAKKRPRSAVVGKVQGVDKKFFDYAVKDNDVPKGGMRLDVDYKLLAGEKLEMDLSGGGKVVLPKGVKANVNGALSNAGETYTSGKVVFKNLIPKGTVFTGKIAFTKTAPKKKV